MRREPGPILLDVGKVKKRALRELERGRGRLMDEVERALREAAAERGEADDSAQVVPVLVVFGHKRRRKKRGSGLLGGG